MTRRLLLAAAFLILVPARAHALTCSFGTVVGVSFGNYNVFSSTPLDSTGSVTYTCTGLIPATITIDLSKGASTTYAARTLKKGATALNYNLFADAARTSIWGDSTGGTSHYGPFLVILGQAATVTVYGRVPALQKTVSAGSYTDTIIATITF